MRHQPRICCPRSWLEISSHVPHTWPICNTGRVAQSTTSSIWLVSSWGCIPSTYSSRSGWTVNTSSLSTYDRYHRYDRSESWINSTHWPAKSAAPITSNSVCQDGSSRSSWSSHSSEITSGAGACIKRDHSNFQKSWDQFARWWPFTSNSPRTSNPGATESISDTSSFMAQCFSYSWFGSGCFSILQWVLKEDNIYDRHPLVAGGCSKVAIWIFVATPGIVLTSRRFGHWQRRWCTFSRRAPTVEAK